MPNLARYPVGFGRRKPGGWAKIDYAHPLTKGLQGAWFLNTGGGTQGRDSSNKGLNLAFQAGTAAPTWTDGAFGSSACNFASASSQFMQTTTAPAFPGPFPCTILSWLQIATVLAGSNHTVFSLTGTVTANAVSLQINTSGQMIAIISGTATAVETVAVPLNTWIQSVAVFYAVSSQAIFQNGGLKVTGTTAGTPTNLTKRNIGVLSQNTNTNFWNGQIDHVLLWNRALSDAEIAWLYREPFAFLVPAPPRRPFKNTVAVTRIPNKALTVMQSVPNAVSF